MTNECLTSQGLEFLLDLNSSSDLNTALLHPDLINPVYSFHLNLINPEKLWKLELYKLLKKQILTLPGNI